MTPAQRIAAKAAIWLVALLPLPLLTLSVLRGALEPDPGEAIVHQLGLCALWLLAASLACTPLRQLSGSVEWLRLRRLLGLFSFFYACLHLLAFALFIVGFNWQQLLTELSERAYIVAGLAAVICLLPLAITSTRSWQRRLGRRWKVLHRLVYVAALLVMVHMWWQVRSDYGEALFYSALLGGLLLVRVLRKA
ncbi:MAG: ferric reductase-like transmembrane domain-containing protein [Gammaproteobacteria bacterium]|nr:ferric reductase-like transmembrane domain-containing protein [Gammaproteobacteria bacterium]NND38007.1 sulfoxide reductase heme-binding subunit YedZ [Pseudomonadales bacterium]